MRYRAILIVDHYYKKGDMMSLRKKQIIDAAHHLFIEKGFASTSIQDILEEAQVAKGTFYNYFTSKNECLMAILEFVEEEGDQKRRELAHGKKKDDEKVFVAQIAVRMNMNREHNIMALFTSVSFSDDIDLQIFLKEQHAAELQWIARRLTEIFKVDTNRYALDHATILLGMVHQLMHVWKLGTNEAIASEDVIQFALDRLKPMIKEQLQSGNVFFPENWLGMSMSCENFDVFDVSETKKHVIAQLEKLIKKMDRNKQDDSKKMEYIRFLQNELQADKPRLFLLESVLISLGKACEQSIEEHNVRQISKMVWVLIKRLEAGK
ncbi:TetR family transcriptional regulator [Virgibacillus dakarensis]|nr:TetR family transcriptional regulator [Virgibacillus dakarensis]